MLGAWRYVIRPGLTGDVRLAGVAILDQYTSEFNVQTGYLWLFCKMQILLKESGVRSEIFIFSKLKCIGKLIEMLSD